MTGIKGKKPPATGVSTGLYAPDDFDIGSVLYVDTDRLIKGLTPGAAGKVLKSTGLTPNIPSYQDDDDSGGSGGGTGALVLLESHTASGASSQPFGTRNAAGKSGATFQSDFDEYLVEVIELVPSTGSTFTWQALSSGTPDTTSGHYHTAQLSWSTGGVGAGGPGSGASILLAPFNGRTLSTTADKSTSGWFRIYNPLGTAHRSLIGEFLSPDSAGSAPQRLGMTAAYTHNAPFDSFEVAVSGGTFNAIIRVYGVAK